MIPHRLTLHRPFQLEVAVASYDISESSSQAVEGDQQYDKGYKKVELKVLVGSQDNDDLQEQGSCIAVEMVGNQQYEPPHMHTLVYYKLYPAQVVNELSRLRLNMHSDFIAQGPHPSLFPLTSLLPCLSEVVLLHCPHLCFLHGQR